MSRARRRLRHLAAEFGKSRTPVREALHRLEIENLVERVPRGMRVRTSSPEEILDIYEVRIMLEGAAAKAAAERATEFDRTQLRSAQRAMGAIEARDGEAARRIAEHHMFGPREVRLQMYADSSNHAGAD